VSFTQIPREFKELPIHLVDAPALPARTQMDEDKLRELAESIKAIGLQQPMIVARTGERYQIIAGHRRRVACELAGQVTAPCIVYPSLEVALEAIKYAENRFREDLNAADEALYFSELLETQCGNDTNRLVDLVHESRAYVEGRLLLFQGHSDVFEALRAESISIGAAHELNKCHDDVMRHYFLSNAIRDGASITIVRGWMQQWTRSLVPSSGKPGITAVDATAAPVPQTNYFTCYVCGKDHDVHLMTPINVHGYCRKAILDPLVHGDVTPATPHT